jgi:hypothetical protein
LNDSDLLQLNTEANRSTGLNDSKGKWLNVEVNRSIQLNDSESLIAIDELTNQSSFQMESSATVKPAEPNHVRCRESNKNFKIGTFPRGSAVATCQL